MKAQVNKKAVTNIYNLIILDEIANDRWYADVQNQSHSLQEGLSAT